MARRTGNKRSRSFFGLSPNAGLRLVGGAALIAASVLAIYWPSLRGDFLLDDELLVSRTTLIRAPDALYRFWFTTQATDYWPVTNSTFWLEFRAWETNATGYHITNLVLHILDCVLIWGILRRLAIPGAFLAALLFAVHPVNVESVAWISQRKNVLSLLFFLLSILFYLRWRAPRIADEASLAQPAAALSIRTPAPTPSSTRSSSVDWKWYLLSLASFVLAGLSKGSVVILPLVLLLILWWQNGGLTVRDLAQAAPFFAVAIVLTLVDVWFQTHGSREVIREATFVQRLLGAGAVVWFYLWKAFVPLHLAFFYPQWDIDPGQVRWWLPLVAWVTVTALLIWRRHSRFGRPLLFAWAFFCLGLLPVMGFTDVGFMKHSLVADHYQHIALVGVVALVAAASSYGFDRWIGQPTHMAVKVIAAT